MKFALIGTGNAAASHVKAVRKVGGELVAVYGKNEKNTKDFASKNKISCFYTNLEEMFKDNKINNKIDAVIIASIPCEHFEHILISSKYVDIIIVEKPIAINLDDLDKVIKNLRSNNKSISVVYQNRYNKTHFLLKKEIEKTKILHVDLHMPQFRDEDYFSGYGDWKKDKSKAGGGVVIQNGIHWINLLFSIIGYENLEVKDVKITNRYGNVEDLAFVGLNKKIEKSNKITCSMFFSRITPNKETKLTVYCEDKIIEVTRSRFCVRKTKMNCLDKVKYYLNARLPFVLSIRRNYHIGTYADFLKEVIKNNSDGERKSIFLEEAIEDVKLINKIYEKIK